MTKLLGTAGGEGERLDRFELIAELASGGMATVFLARLSGVAGFSRMVAIKRLHPHFAKEKEFVEMFLDEARLAARIHHPNVVPILEVGTSERGYYLVMEYIEGDTVARLFAKSVQANTRVPPAAGIRIVLDALAGLHAAHELKDDNGDSLNLVHRDVSPQNILVGVDGTSRITDFGVARASSRLSTTRSGQLKGKLSYMAPEQARGGDVDRRADVFAMGIVLWETLAFRRLFKGVQEAETLNKLLYEPIPPLRTIIPSIPPLIESVVMKALDRDPSNRWDTAMAFADALEHAARTFNTLGATRDVAACVEAVIGTEISQQREAVRAWLARSEPSRNGLPDNFVHGTGPQQVGLVSAAVLAIERSAPPPGVSSVSSAVIQVPPPYGVSASASPPPQPQAPPKGSSRVAWALAAIAAIMTTIAVLQWHRGRTIQAASIGPAAAPALAPTVALPAASPAPVTNAETPVAIAPAPAPSLVPAAHSAKNGAGSTVPRPKQSGKANGSSRPGSEPKNAPPPPVVIVNASPPPTPATATISPPPQTPPTKENDDLSRNPYTQPPPQPPRSQ